MKYIVEFVGGKYNGVRMSLEAAELMADGRSEDLSAERARGAWVHREELDNKPTFDGYCGPMWDGIRNDGTAVLRYETWNVYNMMFD